ncbi:MAG: outer membrane beta-barrel protein [Brumimicrobium sp.]
MKKYLILSLSMIIFSVNAQIITNETETSNKKTKNKEEINHKKEKKKKTREQREKSGVELFVGVSPAYTFRVLQQTEGIFGKPLGIREKEEGKWTTGIHAGARSKLSENFKIEFGAGYYTNKETFDFEEKDTVFRYINTYRNLSFPIRIAYTFGGDISFYGGIGIIPKAFLSMKREETTLDINKQEVTDSWREMDKFNRFLLDGVVTIGTQIKLNKHYGIYAMVEGRYQLVDNYVKQAPHGRHPYSLGFHVGIEVYL